MKPVATRMANEVICLPMHHQLKDEDILRVLELVVKLQQANFPEKHLANYDMC